MLASVQEVTAEARRDRDGLITRLSGIGQKQQQAALAAARKTQAKTEKRLAEMRGDLLLALITDFAALAIHQLSQIGGISDDAVYCCCAPICGAGRFLAGRYTFYRRWG